MLLSWFEFLVLRGFLGLWFCVFTCGLLLGLFYFWVGHLFVLGLAFSWYV